jgi:hypothetical protein
MWEEKGTREPRLFVSVAFREVSEEEGKSGGFLEE